MLGRILRIGISTLIMLCELPSPSPSLEEELSDKLDSYVVCGQKPE
jgi:hypothetical protein